VQSDEDLAKALRRAAETAEQQTEGSLLFVQSMASPLFVVNMFGGGSIVVTSMFMPMVSLITDLSSNG
jgi:type II secretory pathway component PulF